MGGSEGIFRREALEAKARTAGPGRLLKLGGRSTLVAWALLALSASTALAAAGSWQVDRYAVGNAVVGANGYVVATLSGSPASSLRAGDRLHLAASGPCPAVNATIVQVQGAGRSVQLVALLSRPCLPIAQTRQALARTGTQTLLDLMLQGLGI